jgi:ferredoxin
MSEPYVITRLCRDCVDGACVDVCPVDCIYQHDGGTEALPNQLFVNPEECIYCGACEPACPWEAIFAADEVPASFADDVALNALTAARPKEFSVPDTRLRRGARHATPEAVAENKARWAGVEGAAAAGSIARRDPEPERRLPG